MNDDVIISVANLGKAYRIWETPSARLTAPLIYGLAELFPSSLGMRRRLEGRAHKYHRDFWALREINFEVRRGEAVGIIGRNGSGKSTLLQLIVGTLQPTSGSVQVHGRIAALLELGSGFNPDFTGRENVYLNATVLGLKRQEIDARFEAIASFAEIGDFMDQPVKTYSSGMMVRLAFAVQTAVDPDILIVDEALSVGDFFFQQKCFQRIRDLRAQGTTLLFVSHDMGSVRDLCQRALYLQKGHPVYFGPSQTAVAMYYREGESPTTAQTLAASAEHSSRPAPSAQSLDAMMAKALWRQIPATATDDAPAELLAVELLDQTGQPTLKLRMGDTAVLRGYFRARDTSDIHVALELKNRHGQMVSSMGSRVGGLAPAHTKSGEYWCFEARVELALEAGLYSFQVCLGRPHPQPNLGLRFAETPWLGPLTLEWDYGTTPAPFLGMFHVPAQVSLGRVNIACPIS